MQRQASASRAAELPQILQPRLLLISPKGRMENLHLPIYNKKEILKSRLAEKLVHLIPLVLLLCFFILWWFSHPVKPVNLERKDGWITAAYRLAVQNATFFHLTFSPYSSISGIQILSNDSYAE